MYWFFENARRAFLVQGQVQYGTVSCEQSKYCFHDESSFLCSGESVEMTSIALSDDSQDSLRWFHNSN